MPLAIVIEPYSMDCLSESYSKAEQNHTSQAMLLFYSLMAFLITMAIQLGNLIKQKDKKYDKAKRSPTNFPDLSRS